MKRFSAFAIFAAIFSLSLFAYAGAGDKPETAPQYTDPKKPGTRDMDASANQFDPLDYLENATKSLQSNSEDPIFGLMEPVIQIQQTLANKIVRTAAISGDAGTGRTSVAKAVILSAQKPGSLLAKKTFWRLKSELLMPAVDRSMVDGMKILKKVIAFIGSDDNAVLWIDIPEEFDFASSGKMLDVVKEAITANRIPIMIGTNPETETELRKLESVDQRMRTYRTQLYGYETMLNVLRKRRAQLEDFYKSYDVKFSDEVMIHLATQTAIRKRLGLRGNSVALQAMGNAAVQFIQENQQNLSQIGKWEDEIAAWEWEIKSKQSDGNLAEMDLAALRAKIDTNKTNILASSKTVADLDKEIAKLKSNLEIEKQILTNAPNGTTDSASPVKTSDSGLLNKIGIALGMSSSASTPTDTKSQTLKAKIEIDEQQLQSLVIQRTAAATNGRNPAKTIGIELMNQVLAKLTGQSPDLYSDVPSERIENLQKYLDEEVFGQEVASKELTDTIQVLVGEKKISQGAGGQLIFGGPPGVGKTEMAKALAKTLGWGYIYEPMDRYQNMTQISNFLGAGQGLVGYGTKPTLIQALLTQPENSVILLDEIENAHIEVLEQLATALSEGFIQTATNQRISLENKIIIMTTNLGSEFFSKLDSLLAIDSDASSEDGQKLKKLLLKELALSEDVLAKIAALPSGSKARSELISEYYKNYLKTVYPERIPDKLYSRLDIIAFDHLSPETLTKVIGKFFNQLRAKFYDDDTVLTFFSEQAREQVFSKYNPTEGARPLARYVEKRFVSSMNSIKKELNAKQVVVFDMDGDEIVARKFNEDLFNQVAVEQGLFKATGSEDIKQRGTPGELGKASKFYTDGVINQEIIEHLVDVSAGRDK